MSQPSVIQYFSSRKRPAIDDYKHENSKLLKLDREVKPTLRNASSVSTPGVKQVLHLPLKKDVVNKKTVTLPKPESTPLSTNKPVACAPQSSISNPNELDKIKTAINRSAKLSKLKESLARFKKCDEQLKKIENKTNQIPPKLKTFNSIEIEVNVSPQKISSPEKPYLSPRKVSSVSKNLLHALSPKKATSVRKNLLNALSPTKVTTDLICDISGFTDTTAQSLQLPFKYRALNEIFRAIDTVVQIMFNRKEHITFKKLKPAVEEMVKRTFLEKHLAQIKFMYPNAYNYAQVKEKSFGNRQAEWELIITPVISTETMTTQILLNRRKEFHQMLIDKTKSYHNEFLLSLIPPMDIPKKDITRWHPEFDLEKVPEIELGDLPHAPVTQEHTSAKEVLETARRLFNCNTRMNQALLKLEENQKKALPTMQSITPPTSTLKGIPQALLEKVRQKQAAKALLSMTRTADKEKELRVYSRLPELARLTRNLFVTEKKGVLELDVVMEKLGNSYRTSLTKVELEEHLKTISTEVPKWLIFHKLRNSVYLKLDKNADLSLIISKLEKLVIQKSSHS